MDLDNAIDTLRAARQATLQKYSGLDPARLGEQRDWRGAGGALRFRLSWLAEGDESRCVRIMHLLQTVGRPLSVAQQAVIGAGETRGRLLGALIGLPAPLFEQAPAEGEWSVRQVLGHVIATDQRYAIAVTYALNRARTGATGPLRPPDSELPPRTGEAEAAGTPAEVMDRLTGTRDTISRQLAAVPDNLLDAPTNWVSWDLDVRFRIHRFPAHDREHTIQIRKALHAHGFVQTEPQLLLSDAMVARGALESALLAVPPELWAKEPPSGGPSIEAAVEEAVRDEREA